MVLLAVDPSSPGRGGGPVPAQRAASAPGGPTAKLAPPGRFVIAVFSTLRRVCARLAACG